MRYKQEIVFQMRYDTIFLLGKHVQSRFFVCKSLTIYYWHCKAYYEYPNSNSGIPLQRLFKRLKAKHSANLTTNPFIQHRGNVSKSTNLRSTNINETDPAHASEDALL